MRGILRWPLTRLDAAPTETLARPKVNDRGTGLPPCHSDDGEAHAYLVPAISLPLAVECCAAERADQAFIRNASGSVATPPLRRPSRLFRARPHRIFLIGTGRDLHRLNDLESQSNNRFALAGFYDVEVGDDIQSVKSRLEALVADNLVSEIVVAVGRPHIPWEALTHCRFSGLRVTDLLDFYERESREVCIESAREDWIALSEGFKPLGGLRRLFDVLFAVLVFVPASPLLLMTMAAIKLEDGGPVFYGQERTGLLGKPFVLYKLRSMRPDAERDGRPAWASEGDSRITRVGRLIRKLRIDELPQLFNVLRGEMTMIGPRPERPFFVHQFSETIPFYDFRHAVKPGITGWAQVSFRYGASQEDTIRKLSFDLYYVRNRSLFLDLAILLKTIRVVLSGDGAR